MLFPAINQWKRLKLKAILTFPTKDLAVQQPGVPWQVTCTKQDFHFVMLEYKWAKQYIENCNHL